MVDVLVLEPFVTLKVVKVTQVNRYIGFSLNISRYCDVSVCFSWCYLNWLPKNKFKAQHVDDTAGKLQLARAAAEVQRGDS